VTTIAGSGVRGYADGTGLAAQFNQPAGVVVTSSGTIYVSDTYNIRIRAITPDGVVTTIAGSGTTGYADGQGLSAEFNAPTGLVLDAAGTLYVTDTYNQLIRRVTITDPAANPDTPTDSGQSDTTPGVPNTGVKMTRDVGEVLFISGAVFALLVSISIYVFRAKKRSYKR
jgi:serine/threonine-protein kinase